MGKDIPTILAGIPIPLEKILPGKLDLLHGQTGVLFEQEDSGDTNLHPDCSYTLLSIRVGMRRGKFDPLGKIVDLKILSPLPVDHLRMLSHKD
jgi:hypothetical protein